MPDTTNFRVSAFEGVVVPGRYGRRTGAPGVTVSEVRGAGLATVTVRRHRRAALTEAARASFGVELPAAPRRVESQKIAFIWSGPEQWLAYSQPAPAIGMEAYLATAFAGLGSIVDQSHGRTLLRVAGPSIRDSLAKGLAIDLHPHAFLPGYTALTTVAHIGLHIWQLDVRPTYELAVPRGLVLSFWHWLEASAAEYGLEYA